MKIRTKIRAGTIYFNHNATKAKTKTAKKSAPTAKDLVGVKVATRIKAGRVNKEEQVK